MAKVTLAQAAPQRISGDNAKLVLRRMPGLAAVVIMAVIGVGISLYLTSVHYQRVPLICSASGTVDCAPVLQSQYGVIPGTKLPITFPGLLWFLVSGGIALWVLLAAMRGNQPPAWWSNALKSWGVVGLLSILYLVYAEIVKLHHICAWCTIVHTLVLATLIVAFMQDTTIPTLPSRRAGVATAAKSLPKSASAAAPKSVGAKTITSTTKVVNTAKSATASRPLSSANRPTSTATKAKTPVSAGAKKAR